jgi:Ca2+/Na+ antiporter
MDYKRYITPDYLFNINIFASPRLDKALLLLGAAAIVLSIVLKISAVLAPSSVDKKYRGKFFSLLLTAGLWEILWYACAYENVRFFGSHFVAFLGLLVGFIWFLFLIVKMFKNYGLEKQAWEKEQVRLKYLPR